MLPNEALHISCCSVDQWGSLHPFGEQVGCCEQILESTKCLRHFADDIKAPDREWPWTDNHLKRKNRLVRDECMHLAPNTALHVLLGLFYHLQPPIALCQCSLGKCSASRVSPTASRVKFVQNACHLIFVYNAQIRAHERSSVQIVIQIQEIIRSSVTNLVGFLFVRWEDLVL